MAVFVAVFWMRSASKESWFGLVSVTDIPWLDWPVTAMKWMIMLCLPNLILNTIGHLFWPVTWPMEDNPNPNLNPNPNPRSPDRRSKIVLTLTLTLILTLTLTLVRTSPLYVPRL